MSDEAFEVYINYILYALGCTCVEYKTFTYKCLTKAEVKRGLLHATVSVTST